MTRYTIDTVRYPDAICNDGTPAVFYFAGATRTEDRPAIRASGFCDTPTTNMVGTWNRVLVFYCSSDQWAGTRTSTLTASTTGGTPDDTIHFKGSKIVDAVIDTLRYATAGRRRIARHSDSAETTAETWPDLDQATHVIFAGSSGGGNGVRTNADRIGAKLRAANPNLVDYRAIIEAMYGTSWETLDFTPTTLCAAAASGCRYDTYMQSYRAQSLVAIQAARVDESCLQFHAGSEWRCADEEHTLLHHVTTPFFLRQGLQDSLLGGNFVDVNFGTLSDFGRQVESELRNLPVPEEPRGATPGLFVPQCTDHEAFTNNRDVFDVRVNGLSFYDTVSNWWNHVEPQQAIRSFTGTPGPAPDRPP